jgi:hypothetical protein
MIGTTHTNKILTNISIDYSNAGNWLADKVCPPVKVERASDSFRSFDTTFRTAPDELANGAPANTLTRTVATATYYAPEYGNRAVITDRDQINSDNPSEDEQAETLGITENILNNKERRLIDLLFTTTTFSNGTTLAATWNDNTSDVADPVTAVDTGVLSVMKNSGRVPNVAIMGRSTLSHLKNNYKVMDRIKYAQGGVVTADLAAAMFEIDKLYIGNHVQDISNDAGAATGTFSWGDNMFIGFVAPNASRLTPSALAQFSPTGGLKVKRYRNEELRGNVIEVNDSYVFKALATGAGYFINDTNADGASA